MKKTLEATHSYRNFNLRIGNPILFGATIVPEGINFSVYSQYATSCELVLFKKGEPNPFVTIPFFGEFKIGNVFTMIVYDLDHEEIEYGFCMDGPYEPRNGHRFDHTKILMDPYAKVIGGRDVWGRPPDWHAIYPHRSRVLVDSFNWEDDRQIGLPIEDLIIYEMHVRGFTKHPSSNVKHPGTFEGIREKIPYLRQLGINCIELMPIHEFDEFDNQHKNPATNEQLKNFWGYDNVGFFAPKAGFAASGASGGQAHELKALVRDLHRQGIEVILDVVFNHTAEGNEKGPYISYRGIDNKTYYLLTPNGKYYNFSGCGNTLNCNNPVVRSMILDCLRYWVVDYHIDGFRFDLASILGRDQEGAPMSSPPLLETLAFDPVLGKTKLIAEAWDAGGLYQVGSFPGWGRWLEWNGKYRDDLRQFLRGDLGMAWIMAQRIHGSPDLYQWQNRDTCASINFITCHDGFTLMDLVSYNKKHNTANGERNRDGNDYNLSWNCGHEGKTTSSKIQKLRIKQMKNAIAMLFISQGTPMLLAGDEFGRTQKGNNNAYCQDNDVSWVDWSLIKVNQELLTFVRRCIAFRKAHKSLRDGIHFQNKDHTENKYQDMTWHGVEAWKPDWSHPARTLAFMVHSRERIRKRTSEEFIYAAMNMHTEPLNFELPQLKKGFYWHVFCNTDMTPPQDIWEVNNEVILKDQNSIIVGARSVTILVGRKKRTRN